ncbi:MULTISPECIES: hypothetical protein [Burkholderiaceae]|uniref:hypothetical protein n=1 Tax=Burkholderiaceae TaxID=119060 RepID=UPI0010414F7B|nr:MULTISPECIES: hypothetical protein [Burkholderiaceae]MCI1041782.1 hypothetical protein [Caballeronia zhejiangensis]
MTTAAVYEKPVKAGVLNVRLNAADLKMFRNAAWANSVPVADVVRGLVAEWMKNPRDVGGLTLHPQPTAA